MTRICVLTGASGRLGTAFIEKCAATFLIVAVHHRREMSIPSQHQRFVDPLAPSRPLPENANPVHAIRADLSRQEPIDAVCAEVLDRFGRIDVLINAAVHSTRDDLLDPAALDGAERAFLVNVLAPLRLTAAVCRAFWSSCAEENLVHRRHVLNISSTAGVYVYPDLGQAVYSATKAALNFATYHTASDLWKIGVRANIIAPNSFPDLVPTSRVVNEMLALDTSADTGRLVVLEQ
jgi:NAD(P)-dependent dehydrogenase (short-subunit alcohol dehydrogenase family)